MTPAATFWISLLILALVAGLLLAAPVRNARRDKISVPQYLAYLFGRVMARILWRTEVIGRLPVPDGEAAIIICNHRSPFDPAYIQLATRRVVHWMVAREYVESATLGWFLRILRVIPVGRGGVDTAATKQAIRLTQSGALVGMLPEGRINVTDQLLLPGRPGAALVALKARVPVIPCFVSGPPMKGSVLHSLITPAKVRLVIGEPLDISRYYGHEKDREVLEELTRIFLKSIARLAGEPNFEPQLAGRNWKPAEVDA